MLSARLTWRESDGVVELEEKWMGGGGGQWSARGREPESRRVDGISGVVQEAYRLRRSRALYAGRNDLTVTAARWCARGRGGRWFGGL